MARLIKRYKDQTNDLVIEVQERAKVEEKCRVIFESNLSAIVIIESDSKISMVNEAFCQMTGFTKQEVIGKNWTQQIHPEDNDRLLEYNKQRLINPTYAPEKYKFRFTKKDGEIRQVLMSVALIQREDKI